LQLFRNQPNLSSNWKVKGVSLLRRHRVGGGTLPFRCGLP